MGTVMTGTWQRDKLLAALFIYLFASRRSVSTRGGKNCRSALLCNQEEFFLNQRQRTAFRDSAEQPVLGKKIG